MATHPPETPSAARSQPRPSIYTTPQSNISLPSRRSIQAKLKLEKVSFDGNRCVLTLDKEPTDCCHILPRAAAKKPSLIAQLEFAWGIKKLNLDSSKNLMFLRPDLHRTFDSGNWALLPDAEYVKKLANELMLEAPGPLEEVGILKYVEEAQPYRFCHFGGAPEVIFRDTKSKPGEPGPNKSKPNELAPEEDILDLGDPDKDNQDELDYDLEGYTQDQFYQLHPKRKPEHEHEHEPEPEPEPKPEPKSEAEAKTKAEAELNMLQSQRFLMHEEPFTGLAVRLHVHPYYVIYNAAMKYHKYLAKRDRPTLANDLLVSLRYCDLVLALWMRKPVKPQPQPPTQAESNSRTTTHTSTHGPTTRSATRSARSQTAPPSNKSRDNDRASQGTSRGGRKQGTQASGGSGARGGRRGKRKRGESSPASAGSLQTPVASQGKLSALDLAKIEVPDSAHHLLRIEHWAENVGDYASDEERKATKKDAQSALEEYSKEKPRVAPRTPWRQWSPRWMDSEDESG